MKKTLTFKLFPKEQQHSSYDWMNIDAGRNRVGKVRGHIGEKSAIIYSITIFPEYERRGYAARTVGMIKKRFDAVIADRVRPTARGFWEKMGFTAEPDGCYIWRR